MVDLEDLQTFAADPPLRPTPVEHLTRRVERRRQRRWTACAVLAAAVLVAAAVALANHGHEEQRTAGTTEESTAAQQLLLELAARSEAQPPITSDALPILHEATEGDGTTTVVLGQGGQDQAIIVDTNREENWWLSPTRVRNIGRLIGDRRPLNDAAVRYLASQPPMPDLAYRGLLVERDDSMPIPPVDGIDGERTKVSQTVADERSEGRLFDSLVQGLSAANADHQLRAGWLRMLADIDGMRVVPSATDRLGRVGVGIVFTTHEHGMADSLLIFDPATGQLLASRSTVVAMDNNPGIALPNTLETTFTVEAVAAAPAPDVVN